MFDTDKYTHVLTSAQTGGVSSNNEKDLMGAYKPLQIFFLLLYKYSTERFHNVIYERRTIYAT